jgi:hypothetical protein
MPRETRLFLAGNTVSMAGTGLVISSSPPRGDRTDLDRA